MGRGEQGSARLHVFALHTTRETGEGGERRDEKGVENVENKKERGGDRGQGEERGGQRAQMATKIVLYNT